MAVENWQMPAIGAGAAFLGSIPQMVEARRLRKERERLLKEGAPGLTPIEQEQMAAARARAASALAPGYAQEMEGIAQQQADVLAAGKRGSQTSSNLMNLLSRMNAQGQAARRNLAMRGAQAQRAAQSELGSMAMGADARRQQRVQNWEAKLAAMDAARRQYNAAAGMSPVQGAIAFMPTEGLKFTKGKPKEPTTPSPYKSFAEIPSQFSEKEAMYNPYEKMSGMRIAPQAADMGPGATPINTENFHYPESPGKPPIKNKVFGKTVFRYNDVGDPEVFFPNGRAIGGLYGVNPAEFPYEVKDSGWIIRDPR